MNQIIHPEALKAGQICTVFGGRKQYAHSLINGHPMLTGAEEIGRASW